MGHFAKVINGIVVDVNVAEQEWVDAQPDAWAWVQTSYNTYGGVHRLGGEPLRKNYAGIGYRYDSERDAFIPPTPYPSWKLNEDTCLWDAPIPYPTDGKQYIWNEHQQEWTLMEREEI
jgi:hypothetical protein